MVLRLMEDRLIERYRRYHRYRSFGPFLHFYPPSNISSRRVLLAQVGL